MSDEARGELLDLTRRLLASIAAGDWRAYEELCDPSLTAFEPEARGHLVEGMDFHRFYFDLGAPKAKRNTTIVAPHVRLLGKDAAVVSYVRLTQSAGENGEPLTALCEETRVWERRDGRWRHVHFHRSRNG
jgi:hypothetical protein